MTNLCIDTGQTTETLVCPVHGIQDQSHFDIIQENPKICTSCGDGFFTVDDSRTFCAKEECQP